MALDVRQKVLSALLTVAQDADPTTGRVKGDDVNALAAAVGAIDVEGDPTSAAAAKQIGDRIQFDSKIDDFDVPVLQSAAKALQAALGGGSAMGPLDRALTKAAVPTVNVTPGKLGLDVDLRNVGDASQTSFPAVSRLTLKGKLPETALLAVHPDRIKVKDVQVGGQSVPFKVEQGRLSFKPGTQKDVTVSYDLTPQFITKDEDWQAATGLIVDRRDPKNVQIASLLWPYNTDQLFPSNPDPAVGLTAKVNVQSPTGFVTNATHEDKLVPSYDVAIRSSNNMKEIEGPTTASGTKLNFWVYKDHALRPDADFKASLENTAKHVAEIERILKTKYPDKEINFQETTGGLGGMEHQGMPFIYDGAIADTSKIGNGLFLDPSHETDHAYFGNGVRIKDWPNFSLSEGFVEYLTYRGEKAAKGNAEFKNELELSKDGLSRYLIRSPANLVTPKGGDINEYFTNSPYELGSWCLRMIECKLGTDTFDNLLAEFYHAHDRKAASLSDWAGFLTKKTGQDFNAFYQAWGTIKGVPNYELAFTPSGNSVDLAFRGLNVKLPAGTTVPVKLEGANGESKTLSVTPDNGDFTDGAHHATLDAGFPVTKVTMDPDETVLANFTTGTPIAQ